MENNNTNSAFPKDNQNLNSSSAQVPIIPEPIVPMSIENSEPVSTPPIVPEPMAPTPTESPEPVTPLVSEPVTPAMPEPEPIDPMSAIDNTNMNGIPVASSVDSSASLGSVYKEIPSDPNYPENNAPYSEPQPPMAKKSHGLMFALIGLAVFLFLLFSAAGVAVMAAYGKIDLPDKKMQEDLFSHKQP